MKKREYIEKAKQTILNRVKFHAPKVFSDDIDQEILKMNGVDVSKPIFKFDKILTKPLAKAFRQAKREQDFNLILPEGEHEKFDDAIFYDNKSSKRFLEMVNKLNINYSACSNYNPVFKDQYFKINNTILNPHFEDFALVCVSNVDDVFVQYKEFVLNGSNFYIHLQRKDKKINSNEKVIKLENLQAESEKRRQNFGEKMKVCLELNIPLEKGYYFFKKLPRCVEIHNLVTREKFYLNFVSKNAKFNFSNVDGLENSTFCCVNVKIELLLEDEEYVFFNFGSEKFVPKSEKEIKNLYKSAYQKCCEIFNLQIKTKMPKFDYYFNKILPQKIWINWLNKKFDYDLEEKYLNYKKLFVRGDKNISFVNFKEIGLRELGIFNGEYYKKILIISGGEKFLRVGKTFFYNINGVTETSLSRAEPITLCFGN